MGGPKKNKEVFRIIYIISIIIFLLLFTFILKTSSPFREQLSPSSLQTEPYTITLCKNKPATLDNKVEVSFYIPEGIELKFGYIEIIAYSDPDDPYKRAIHLFIDGIGGPIGTERVGLHQYTGDTIEPGEIIHRYYNLSRVKFGNAPEDENGYFLIDFIPDNNDSSPVKLTSGQHNAVMCVSNEEKYCDFIIETRLTVYLRLNQQIPNVDTSGDGSVTGDSEITPPLSEEEIFSIISIIFIVLISVICAVTVISISRWINRIPYVTEEEPKTENDWDDGFDDSFIGNFKIKCPRCGRENIATNKYCAYCGYNLP